MRYAILLLAVTISGCSRYDYTERAAEGVRQPVRVDRVTGRTEALSSNAGWVELKVKPQPTPIPASVPCSAREIEIARQPPHEFDVYLPDWPRIRHCRSLHATTASR